MPLYEYKCQQCGASVEDMVGIALRTARELFPCPSCGERALKRVIGVPAVHGRYSPCHPRHMRGQRTCGRKRK